MTRLSDKIWEKIPTVKLPTMGKPVDIPVYVIHNSGNPEDYFFIFDFEQFVERSRGGMFVRPKLKVWAGRSDFARRKFARQFRESFSAEFEAARRALYEQNTAGRGWLGWDVGVGLLTTTIPGAAAVFVLWVALSAGSKVWSILPERPRLRRKQSAEERLESSIADTQGKVDRALVVMEVTVHRDLRRYAFRGSTGGTIRDLDADAWPLPVFVSRHLSDENVTGNKTTSWW